MKKNVIEVKNLSKSFKIPHEKISTVRGAFVNAFKKRTFEEFKALNNISFEVEKGEFFGIIGQNGSGKSTLLKILAGIYSQDRGETKVNGLISPFLELGIGFNPELSGRDNIYLNGTVLGLTKKQVDERFDDIVRFSELRRFIDQKVKNYSSGMQVRLAFSVAIHADRDILLMDEVLAVGDARFQQKCLDIFRKFKKEGKTIVFVSHDLDSVKNFCDRVMLINKGRMIIIAGPERAIYEYSQIMMKEAEKQKRIEKKKKVGKLPSKEKVKKNRVLDVNFLNKDGKKVRVFESKEDLIMNINFQIRRKEKDMYLGVAVFEKNSGAWICGNNTFFDNFKHKWKIGKNVVKLRFPNNTFNKGDFYMFCSFFKGDPKDNVMYDFYDSREHETYFRVLSRSRKNGAVLMEHDWQQGK